MISSSFLQPVTDLEQSTSLQMAVSNSGCQANGAVADMHLPDRFGSDQNALR